MKLIKTRLSIVLELHNNIVKNIAFIFCCLAISGATIGQNKVENKLPVNVAILIYDGVYLLDFAGPLEVFFDSYSKDFDHLFNVYTVSESKAIKAHSGTEIIADYELASCPEPTILVVPGGNLNLLKNKPEVEKWLLESAANTQTLMSVCTGAFILADAGLLDSLNITTWHGALDKLQTKVPSATVVNGVRYTDNGKIVTTSGVSAGIDGALFVVSKYFGKAVADSTAAYMDYEYWK